jgi:dTDP-4-amino-4,6-dideoxygalactose transaminase
MNIPLFKVFMSENVPASVEAILMSGYIGQGEMVEKFEARLRSYFGNSYVATTNSGTSALHLALHMINDDKLPYDAEVITTPLTCTATNFPIVANGYNIRWADVDPKTCNIDLQDVRRKLSPNTAAIMAVHWGGYPVDLDELRNIQDQCFEMYGFRPPVVEDCAHAFGAEYKDKLLGNHGNYCMFSFQAIKHLTCGDGGCLISPSYERHQRAKLLRWYGLDREKSPDMRCEQNVRDWGFKFHMNDISAAIGQVNFSHVHDILEKHRKNGHSYLGALEGVPGITLLEDKSDRQSSYWIFTMRVENRDGFMKKMNEQGVAVSRVHDRNDKHECLKQFRSPLPNTDVVCSDMICLPCGWWVGEEEREYIIECIKKGW